MPISMLDPKTALLVVDLQKGIVNGNFIHPIGDIIDRTRTLIDVFRAKNLPVVLVNVAGRTEQGPRQHIVSRGMDRPSAAAGSATKRYVTKRSWGAFVTTDLEHVLYSEIIGITPTEADIAGLLRPLDVRKVLRLITVRA